VAHLSISMGGKRERRKIWPTKCSRDKPVLAARRRKKQKKSLGSEYLSKQQIREERRGPNNFGLTQMVGGQPSLRARAS